MDFRKCLVAGFAALALLSFAVLPAAARSCSAEMSRRLWFRPGPARSRERTAVSLGTAHQMAREIFQVRLFLTILQCFNRPSKVLLELMDASGQGVIWMCGRGMPGGEIGNMSTVEPLQMTAFTLTCLLTAGEQARTIAELNCAKKYTLSAHGETVSTAAGTTRALLNTQRRWSTALIFAPGKWRTLHGGTVLK